jgi:phospholipid transport system substrate-binding protein
MAGMSPGSVKVATSGQRPVVRWVTSLPPGVAGRPRWTTTDINPQPFTIRNIQETIMQARFASVFTAAMILLLPILAETAAAGAPSDQIKAHVDSIYRAAKGGSGDLPEARKIMQEMFDWDDMARQALSDHWRQRSAAERAQFVGLFAAVFEKAYLSRIHLVDADRFQYLGDAIQGDQSQVKTKVSTKSGQDIAVNYRARLSGQRWKVYDLDVDGISLLDNYRKQFNSVIRRSSYEDLVSRLTKTVQQGKGDVSS